MNSDEIHNIHRSTGLRTAVLRANDDIISTASLVIAVVAAGASAPHILLVGVVGLVAGAMSISAG